jgi:hypothetical protein
MEPNPLTPDVAEKVLRADLQNTVAKVAAGGKLAATDRQRFEAASVPASPTAEDLARLRLNRQAALIRRWAEGGKLTPDEMAEVHPILPAELLASTPAQICTHVRTRTRLLKAYEDYAKFFGKGLRTVKRWAAVGKAKGDPFPFDDPPSVPAWWGRNMEYSIPAEVLAACTGEPPAATSAPPLGDKPPDPPGAKTEPPSNRQAINVHDLAAIGLKENVERLSRIHRANLELLEKAFGGSSDIDLQLRQKNVEKSARMLSDAQRNYDAYQKEHGELVELAEVKREMLRVHASMAQSLVSIFVGLGINRERALSSVDTWFKHLRETRFASGTAPELRPATASAA